MIDITIPLLFAGLLYVVGLRSILKRRFTLHVRSLNVEFNKIESVNVAKLVLTQDRAVLFGAVNLIMGVILMGMSIYFNATPGDVRQKEEILNLAILLAVPTSVFIFVLELFLEFIVWLQTRPKKKRE